MTAPMRQRQAYIQNVPAGLIAYSSGSKVSVVRNEVPQLKKMAILLARFLTSGGNISPVGKEKNS